MHVAVLGTGIMGSGMARSLTRAGHEVTAWNRTRATAEPLSQNGIRVVSSVREAVQNAEAVLTMLFDADATADVAEEMLPALPEGTVWLQTATVGLPGIRRLRDLAPDRLVDAPVLGTKQPAANGTLVVLASGPEMLVDRSRPVLDAIGSKTIVVGNEAGAASALKLACNAHTATLMASVAQSLALAQALGVDPSLFLHAIENGPVDSPYVRLKAGAILAANYSPSFAVDGVVKDVSLMLEAADGTTFSRGLLEAVRSLFAAAAASGHGEEDMAAVRYAFSS